MLTYKGGLLDGKPPVVTYKPELAHTLWQFPANAEGASTAAKPTVSSSLPDTSKADRLPVTAGGIGCRLAYACQTVCMDCGRVQLHTDRGQMTTAGEYAAL